MRRTFAQVISAGKIDIKNEYSKFYELFYEKDSWDSVSVAEMVDDNFINYHFRGTCLSLDEFNRVNNFNFQRQPQNFDEEYLVSFMEYIHNFVVGLNGSVFLHNMNNSFFINQIQCVADKIGYIAIYEEGVISYVQRDSNAIVVAESEYIPENLSYKVLAYGHRSMKGDVEAKKEVLVKLANILEGKRKKLEVIDNKFSSDLFYLFNSCNIRHNNIEESSGKYRKYISDMSVNDLEKIYDEIYQMCLLAFMRLEHEDRKVWLVEIKKNIDNIK